jgi:hypothetical protein
VPETAKSASPAASKSSTELLSLSTAENQWKVITPARIETAKYRQSLIAAGGTDPIKTSRVIPPKISGDKRKHEYSEQIELALHPGSRPTDCKHKSTDEIKHQQQQRFWSRISHSNPH